MVQQTAHFFMVYICTKSLYKAQKDFCSRISNSFSPVNVGVWGLLVDIKFVLLLLRNFKEKSIKIILPDPIAQTAEHDLSSTQKFCAICILLEKLI